MLPVEFVGRRDGEDITDPISGKCEVVFELRGTRVPGKFKVKLDGNKITGTAESEHSGGATLSKGLFVGDHIASRSTLRRTSRLW
jgi:hypothetical protein